MHAAVLRFILVRSLRTPRASNIAARPFSTLLHSLIALMIALLARSLLRSH